MGSQGSASEIPLTGGWSTDGVVRVGETVRRPAGPRSSFVGDLLRFLESRGFEGVPRFLGYDQQGREILTFIDGEVPSDCHTTVWTDEQLSESIRLLRAFHDQTAGCSLSQGEDVVCHNDYGPWNLIWRNRRPVAIIDFDNAASGSRLTDLGYAAWKHLNLGLVELGVSEQRRRLRVLTENYGVQPNGELLAEISHAQNRMRRLIEAASTSSAQGDAALSRISQEQEWLKQHGQALVS